jgi:stage III sporulation protein AE
MKKIIKAFGILIICAFIALFFCVNVYAKEETDYTSTAGKELYDVLPDDTKELLKSLGVDSVSFDDIFNTSASKIWELAKKLITGSIESPLKSMTKLLAVIILLAICECFAPDESRMKIIMEMVGALFCTISVISPLATAISSAVASIAVSESFMLTLIPILAAVISVAGNPTLALSFQSIAFAAAQAIAGASKTYIVPIVGAVLALDITGAIMPSFHLSGITGLIKKTITVTLSFVATIFVSFLGIKGALANAADTVASKGIKLVISSAVPVVGGALSEAYSGVIGSLVLVKSTLGIFGIAAIALINLPSCIQLLFWIFALRVGAAAGDLFNQQGISDLLRAVSSAITLLNVVLLFNAVLFIISTALILTIKAG